MIYTYAYPRPAVTVDIIITKISNNKKFILLIQRKNEPFKNQWALPGGFIEMDEELENSAYRELKEETSIEVVTLKQFKTYGTIGRDPRGRVISIIYSGELTNTTQNIKAGDDAKHLEWFTFENLPELAFDHSTIIKDFISSL